MVSDPDTRPPVHVWTPCQSSAETGPRDTPGRPCSPTVLGCRAAPHPCVRAGAGQSAGCRL